MRLHAWTGLVAGPLVLVLGLSGATLVFRAELDELLTPSLRLGVAAAAPSLDAVLRAALLPHPGGEARALRVAAQAGRPYRVELIRGPERIDVDVDPATLRVVASRAPERSVFAAVHALHAGLHAGRAGAAVVALLGLWLVVEGVSGLWLYGGAMTPPTGARKHRSSRTVHRVVGAASLAAGIVLGLTGALLALASALSPPGASASTSPAPGGLAGLDAAVARVERVAPGARIVAVVAEPADVLRVEVRAAGSDAAQSIRLVRASGAVVGIGAAPSTAWHALRRLHAGDFAGWLVRGLYAAVGLALAVLAMTGSVIAARRQRSKVLT